MNIPNILSNDLDQVAKNHSTAYEKTLADIQHAIEESFDSILLLDGEPELLGRLRNNSLNVPLDHLSHLKPGEKISFEIARREKEKPEWWISAVWAPLSFEELKHFIGDTRYSKMEKAQEAGEVSTLIVIERTFPKSGLENNKDFIVKAYDIEYPHKDAAIPKYVFFKKELSAQEFLESIHHKDL